MEQHARFHEMVVKENKKHKLHFKISLSAIAFSVIIIIFSIIKAENVSDALAPQFRIGAVVFLVFATISFYFFVMSLIYIANEERYLEGYDQINWKDHY